MSVGILGCISEVDQFLLQRFVCDRVATLVMFLHPIDQSSFGILSFVLRLPSR